jgi:hypothetical protein
MTLHVWANIKIPQKHMDWGDLITSGSKINGPIRNPSHTYINIINTPTAGVTNQTLVEWTSGCTGPETLRYNHDISVFAMWKLYNVDMLNQPKLN